MPLPQRVSFITFGARSVATLRDFYRSWGWIENDGASDDFVAFTTGTVTIALYPIDLLQAEAAPDAAPPNQYTWNGITTAINFPSRSAVDEAIDAAVASGAQLIGQPADRSWGGYSGYVADPEGHRWELAWAPDVTDPTGNQRQN